SIPESDRLILLSTCSSDSTNGRIVLVGRITTETYEDTFVEERISLGSDSSINWYHLFLFGIIIVLVICIVIVLVWSHKKV
ncbi:MAG: hypothetical protein ACI4UK_07705, partial [Floccifex sp.]